MFRHAASAALAPLAILSLGVALWLGTIVLTVLPVRDPAHVAFWSIVALAFAAYAAVSLRSLARPSRVLNGIAATLSVAALAAGAAGLALSVRSDSAHFEGYQVLMSLVLLAHGAAGALRASAAA